MSTNEPKTVKKSYQGYNDHLELVSKEVLVTIPEVTNDDDALQELSRIGDLKAAANFLLRREALQKAKSEAGLSNGISSEVVNEFVKPYRFWPKFAEMVNNETDLRKIPADLWNAQTKAILDGLKHVPGFIENIKAVSASRTADDE